MAIRTDAQRKALAAAYAAAAPYGAIFGSDPGTAGAATGEITGGSPAYARKAVSWGSAATSGSTAVVTSASTQFDMPSGSTAAYGGVCASSVAGTADVRDSAAVTSQPFSSQGTYTVTFTYTQA
jgi:hypothetical protein